MKYWAIKLKRHLQTKHSKLSYQNSKIFEIKEQNFKKLRVDLPVAILSAH